MPTQRMLDAYIGAAMTTSLCFHDPRTGAIDDEGIPFSLVNAVLSPEAIRTFKEDIDTFCDDCEKTTNIELTEWGTDFTCWESAVGHDLWFSQDRREGGFEDTTGSEIKVSMGQSMGFLARLNLPERYLYLGDDGLIYLD